MAWGFCRLFLDAPQKYRAVEVWRSRSMAHTPLYGKPESRLSDGEYTGESPLSDGEYTGESPLRDGEQHTKHCFRNSNYSMNIRQDLILFRQVHCDQEKLFCMKNKQISSHCSIKGNVQRKLTGVKTRLKLQVLLQCCCAGIFFFILFRRCLVFSIILFPISTVQRKLELPDE